MGNITINTGINGGGGGGGGGAVNSVFGRTGTVTAQAGDYSASQITGLASIATSGSASDLTTGTVGTARLGTGTASSSTYLRGDGTWATVSGGDSVSGASALTTVGAIPYVSSSGTLGEDSAGPYWDASVKALALGSAAMFEWSSTSSANGTPDTGISRSAAGLVEFNNGTSGNLRDIQVRSINPSTGNVIVGGTTNNNFKLDIASSGSSGSFRVFNQSIAAGETTRVIVQAALNQSSTNLMEWRNNSGSALCSITSGGIFAVSGNVVGITNAAVSTIQFSSGSGLSWSSTSTYGGGKDVAIARNAAGVIEINSATAGTYRDLILRRSQHSGVTVANLPAAAAGNAGSIQYVTDANATTIGSTVAGGGANKVMVWSDGAAWKIFAS